MRRSLLLIGVFCSAWAAESRAQIRFETPSLTQVAGGAPAEDLRAGLSVGDLNHDGILDVVAPSQLGAVVLIGRGDGTLSLPVTVGGNAPFSTIADFDGDGHVDIGWVHGVAYGDGSGANWELAGFSSGYRGGVVAADFDGDGLMDFAAVQYPDTILTFLSRPNRTHQRIVGGVAGLPGMSGTKAMRVCDLNRDGRQDIVFIAEPYFDYEFSVLIGRGDGTFNCRNEPIASPEPQGLGIADFTGDGVLDIAVAAKHLVSLFRGLGDGTFAPRQTAAFDTLDERDIVAGDVTGDGIPDLVTSDLIRRRLLVRAGFGNGTFGPRIASNVDLPVLGLELADMNRDGRLDVVSLCDSRLGVVVALGDGAGRFGAQLPRLVFTDFPIGIAIGDVDNDGRLDVVGTTHWLTPTLEAFLNQGGRNFVGPVVTTLPDPGQGSAWRVHLADLDLDSRLDAVINFDWSVETALGNGDGTFRAHFTLSFPGYLEDSHVEDVNGDFKPDLIGTGATGIRVWPGLGDGTFGVVVESPLPDRPNQLADGDLNGDGVIDLGVVMGAGVTHALGVGNGTFVLEPGMWVPSPTYAQVAVGDVTGDGRDDLVGMKAESPWCDGALLCSRVASRRQNPVGAMGAWLDAPWTTAWWPRIGDVNGDGIGDLLFAADLGFGMALGDSSGHFTIEPGYGGEISSDMRVGDLDGDGRVDVAVTGENGVSIYYGRNPPPLNVATPDDHLPDDTRRTRILGAYPNPSRSGLRVRFRAAGPGPVVLSLFDAAGRRARALYRGILEPADGGREIVASVGDLGLAPGLYFLHLVSPTGTDTRRVAVVR